MPEISDAIVRISRTGGRGVLVGEVILTAAHCSRWTSDSSMIVGDTPIEVIKTRRGDRIRVTPLAVEPVSDIAVLGCLDNQSWPDQARAFHDYCNAATPLRLAKGGMRFGKPVSIRVLNANGKWTSGKAESFGADSPFLWVDTEAEIKNGASGGPILNERGELVAIVSNCSIPYSGMECTGHNPRPLKALPRWIVENYLCRVGDRCAVKRQCHRLRVGKGAMLISECGARES
jgi:hypothetical protein